MLLIIASFIQIKWYHTVTWIFIAMVGKLSISSSVGSLSFPLCESVYNKNERGVLLSSVFFLPILIAHVIS